MANPIFDNLLNIAPDLLDLAPPGVIPPGLKQGMELLGKVKGCGATAQANAPRNTVPITASGGRHAIVYWIEENSAGLPLLPVMEGETDSEASRMALRTALEIWEGQLKMDVTPTWKMEKANLIITGKMFRPPTPDSVLALTDIGPLFDKKCRLVFDLGEKLNKEQFQYTVMHEFGHALGISHADVNPSGALMSPVMDTSIKRPTPADLKAAEAKGWKRSSV